MAISTGTTCESNLSLTGQLFASNISSVGTIIGSAVWGSAFSGSVATFSGNVVADNVITVVGGTFPKFSSTSSLVAAFVVQGSASSFTVITWSQAQAGDQILTTVVPGAAVSSVSSGLVPWSHCTQTGQFEFRLSNVSTLVQNQSSKTWLFTLIRPQTF